MCSLNNSFTIVYALSHENGTRARINSLNKHHLYCKGIPIVGSVNRITITERIKAPFLV